jgi:RNA recognition motif-containing protein
MNTCYVGNIAWATTNADLEASFSAAGARSIELQIQSDSGRTKGWALVSFSTSEEAQAFIDTYNLFMLHDRGDVRF